MVFITTIRKGAANERIESRVRITAAGLLYLCKKYFCRNIIIEYKFMKQKKLKTEKRPARNATPNKDAQKSLVEMDSDEILEKYGESVAGGEIKKKPKMKVSGKSVFKIREIVLKKARKDRSK